MSVLAQLLVATALIAGLIAAASLAARRHARHRLEAGCNDGECQGGCVAGKNKGSMGSEPFFPEKGL